MYKRQVHALAAEAHEVEVEGAIPPAHVAHPAVGVLDAVECGEQRVGVEGRAHGDDRVEVGRGIRVDALGLESGGLVEARCSQQHDAVDRRDVGDGGAQGGLAVAEIAAESDDRGKLHAQTLGSNHSENPVGVSRSGRPRVIVTDTSSNGTEIGAWGLCTVTLVNLSLIHI